MCILGVVFKYTCAVQSSGSNSLYCILQVFFCVLKHVNTILADSSYLVILILSINQHSIILLWYNYRLCQTTERKFLPWQTWDLMKIMYYGFKDFTTLFLQTHKGYVIRPVRLNISAIETVFSQLKGIAHGNLSARNYSLH